jgi:hypothetical protein
VARSDGRRERRLQAGQARLRAPALRALHQRLDGKAQGHPPHDRRLSHLRDDHLPRDLRPQGGRYVLVHRRHRLGHRSLLRRLRDPGERRDHADVRGHADPPRARSLLGHHRAAPRHRLLHRPDGDPHLHPAGRRASPQARPVLAASARHRRRAHQPRGLDVVPPGHRGTPLPDRGHVVADGDRRHPHHAPARRRGDQAGLGNPALPRHRAGRLRRRWAAREAARRRPARRQEAVAGDAARHLGRPAALQGAVLESLRGHLLHR